MVAANDVQIRDKCWTQLFADGQVDRGQTLGSMHLLIVHLLIVRMDTFSADTNPNHI